MWEMGFKLQVRIAIKRRLDRKIIKLDSCCQEIWMRTSNEKKCSVSRIPDKNAGPTFVKFSQFPVTYELTTLTFQVVRAFSNVQFDEIWLINAEETRIVRLTSTIGTNANIADSRNVSRWGWRERVGCIDMFCPGSFDLNKLFIIHTRLLSPASNSQQ